MTIAKGRKEMGNLGSGCFGLLIHSICLAHLIAAIKWFFGAVATWEISSGAYIHISFHLPLI